MCGIVAIIAKDWDKALSTAAEKAFTQMLFTNAVRGTDGTGFFYYNKFTKKVEKHKLGLPSWEAIPKMPALKQLAMKARWVVGHNRKATFGKHSEENSHPFTTDKITLVHNGTLDNSFSLEKDTNADVNVDSAVIPHVLIKHGVKQGLEKLEGAYALVWYDEESNKLFFCRNKERPLKVLETEHFYVLSSEAGLAQWILSRNEIAVTKTYSIDVGVIYSLFQNKNNKVILHKTKFSPKETEPHKLHPYQYQYPPYNATETRQLPITYSKTTEKDKTTFNCRYQAGDEITCRITSTEKYPYSTKISGITLEKPAYTVVLQHSTALDLPKRTYMSGYISSVLWNGVSPTIYITSPKFKNTVTMSGNGEELTQLITYELDDFPCKECGDTTLYNYEECYVEYNNFEQKYTFLCPTCAWEHKEQEMLAHHIQKHEEKRA